MKKEHDEEMLQQVDPNLQPEDEGVIRRYLRYADTLLGTLEEPAPTFIQRGSATPAMNASVTRPDFPVRFELSTPHFDHDDKAA